MTTTPHTSRRRLAAAALLISAGAGMAAMAGQGTAAASPTTVPAPPPTSDRYVAIAYGPSIQFTGVSINTTQQAASSEAVYRCSSKARDCQVVVVAKNGCAALAVDGTRFFGGIGPSYAAANGDARLGLFNSGTIKANQCA
ncbi:hypothetical protein TUM20985_55830 [Mycobacterium antarcticum]|uniref:DUF4189 domain-containing protein n=1 Tax=unclassified Mycolicibacterium TaxID=2636767 RepID=UPI00238EF220|nr:MULTISPECIES: DUF4189 domain-containing protein [unclassified Mycolicibacterium]BDX35036.1 hypothetical protein TUM20985_55830 [Mycolicibacterium sp. TUM20985]GLP78259.1 hypothetical protein TUM20983_53690 [Mycolicibacterium sp. TUM20983]GLP81315.1 hypothetical protein TUM20984_27350 [Mycolicibacterium sp. TUM20984]